MPDDKFAVGARCRRPVVVAVDFGVEGELGEQEVTHALRHAAIVSAHVVAALGREAWHRLEQLAAHEVEDFAAGPRRELVVVGVCKPFADCLQLELSAFTAIIERTRKGEVYEG